jgi:uncharacterized membrane protein
LYASKELLERESKNIEHKSLNAHNALFNMLAEFGIIGLGIVLIVLGVYFRSFVHVHRLVQSSIECALAATCFLTFIFDYFFGYFYLTFAGTILLILLNSDIASSESVRYSKQTDQ